MTSLPVTSLVAASLAILHFILTLLVSMRRASLGKEAGDLAKYVFGDGDDEVLRRRTRAFGNSIEYVPFCVLLIGLLEAQGAPSTLVIAIGSVFTIGRYSHAIGMLTNPRQPMRRIGGMLATYATFLISAGWLISRFF